MSSIFKFFANILGYLLNMLYVITNNYGFAILLFTIIITIIMIPIDIKNRKINKQSAKMSKIQNDVKKKFANNPEKINSELMKEMQRQNINPLSSCTGCLVSILQLMVMISIFFLVGSPLKYLKKLPDEEIQNYYSKAIEQKYEEKYNEKINYNEILENYKKSKQNDSEEKVEVDEEKVNRIKEIERNDVKGQKEMFIISTIDDEKVNMNFDFLGIDLSKTPKDTINGVKDIFKLSGIKVLIIPVSYIVLSFISAGIMQKKMEEQTIKAKEEVKTSNKIESKYKNDSSDSEKLNQEDMQEIMMSSNKTMRYIMPIMIFSITMVTPIAIALYWFLNTAFDLIKNNVIDKLIEKEEEKEKNN